MGQKRITRVVIDTNVIVSALLFGGTPGKLIPLWKNNEIKPFVTQKIIGEYINVLAYPKFDLVENEINYLIYNEILPYFDVIQSEENQRIVLNDPSDDKFIQCAISANADYIISGDHHLLSIAAYKGVKIVTASQFNIAV
jgi:putative PIN family toxin of toxin-antitoxin system